MKYFNRIFNTNDKKGFTAKLSSDTLQIDIFSNIDEWWGYGVSMLTNQLAEAKGKPLLVRVNSFGGSVVEGYAISNLLKGYSGDVTIQIVGYACSIATVFTTAQKNVQIAKDAFFMIHNPSTLSGGTAKTLESDLEALKMFENKLIDTYIEAITRRGKMKATTREDLIAAMDKETWFTAQEAFDWGFVDEVIDGIDTLDNTLSASNIYDNYFYNSATDFKNMPDDLKNKFSNNKNSDLEMVTQESIKNALAEFFGVKAEANATPDNEAKATPDVAEMTIEAATEFLEKNGKVVTDSSEVVSADDLKAQVTEAVNAAVETARKQWVADAAKGNFTAPKATTEAPKTENSTAFTGFTAAIKTLKV